MSNNPERPKMARPDPPDALDEIPTFGSEDEAREFWATHDSAPFFEQLDDVSDAPPVESRIGPGRAGSTARRRPA